MKLFVSIFLAVSTILIVSCSPNTTSSNIRPSVSGSPSASENTQFAFSPIANTDDLIKAVHLYNDAGKIKAKDVLKNCDNLKKVELPYLMLKDGKVYCAEYKQNKDVILDDGPTWDTKDAWSEIKTLNSNSVLIKMSKAVSPKKMAVITPAKVDGKIGVQIIELSNPSKK
jgi:hypothetical protein